MSWNDAFISILLVSYVLNVCGGGRAPSSKERTLLRKPASWAPPAKDTITHTYTHTATRIVTQTCDSSAPTNKNLKKEPFIPGFLPL